jgi:16S rRNA (uracil1498-N3)-methyltransferase
VLTVGFVPVKGDRPEWAVQKLTELGVDRIVVLSSERNVVRWEGSRLASHLDRLQRVARAALMQSRQVWLPAVSGVVPVESFLAPPGNGGSPGSVAALPAGTAGELSGAGCPPGVAVADMAGGPLGREVHTVLVGPEGGWSDEERDAFGRSAVGVVGLGPAVLRAETAAVAAGVLMTALRAGVVAPVRVT